MTGKDHFSTFDNTGYRFTGACSSMLVIDNENPNQFKVVLNGDPNCNVSVPCQKSLDMIVDGVSVHLGATTNTSFVVKVDGNPISLPYTASSPLIKRVSDSYISFVETRISISQSVRQSVSQSVSQPDSQPITWPTVQSVGQSVSQSVSPIGGSLQGFHVTRLVK